MKFRENKQLQIFLSFTIKKLWIYIKGKLAGTAMSCKRIWEMRSRICENSVTKSVGKNKVICDAKRGLIIQVFQVAIVPQEAYN